MIKKEHRFIVVAIDCSTKFVEGHALKALMKQEITQFLYEWVFIQFGTPLKIVSNNGPQFLNEVMENLLTCLVVRFTIMYKLNTNGLVKITNKTLCFMLAKKAEVHVNIYDWDIKIHHVVWVYNTTYKITTGYSLFRLTYRMEALFYPLSWK